MTNVQKTVFEEMQSNYDMVDAFLRQQQSAPSIALMGPSGSGKSNLITSILSPEANKLLSKNIGISAQTTVIPLQLMLNNRLNEMEVLIQCEERDISAFTDFKESIITELSNKLYSERDELENFYVDDNLIKSILNPSNRAFHAYEFAYKKGLMIDLKKILDEACSDIINIPERLDSTADKLFKEKRQTKKNIKKQDIYLNLIDERLSDYLNKTIPNEIFKWFEESLLIAIKKSQNDFWTFESQNILLADLSKTDLATRLIESLYGDESACSLIYKEVRFATCPSKELVDTYQNKNIIYNERTIKLNILDTIGLTQTSHEKEVISDNMDQILDRKSNAIIFLCSAEEKPIVYETCISLLHEKKNKFATKPILICRTKADLIIRNIATKDYQTDTGKNDLKPDIDLYESYVKNAYQKFLDSHINESKHDENSLGLSAGDKKIEFISLAPDISSMMNKYLDGALDVGKIRIILFGLTEQIDLLLNSGKPRLWLRSKTLTEVPLNAIATGAKPLSLTIANAMTAKDHQTGKQYKEYISKNEIYHGRSVNCFRIKLNRGDGHETNANYYDNFRLYITQMVGRWLKEVLPEEDVLSHFEISFEFLKPISNDTEVKKTLQSAFSENLSNQWPFIVMKLAKKLSYDCFKDEFEKSFYNDNWSNGFRKSLKVISKNFSSVEYWENNIFPEIRKIAQEILQTMYVYD